VLADAVVRRVTSPAPVNLAFGTRMSILELARELAAAADVPLDTRHEPPRAGDVRDSQAADGRLRSLFPDVRPIPMDAGLEETVKWFRSLPQYAKERVLARRITDPAKHP
jgi:UDP-glucose 4-epimerase